MQYAKTEDGVSIAYWTLGEGEPLVYIPNLIWSHSQQEWRIPEMRHWFECLAKRRRLVRFDPRGTGLSQRTVSECSLHAIELDVQAVVKRLGLETFALFGDLNAGQAAMAYAAHHPEKVSQLILWCSYARSSDTFRSPRWQALQALMGKDWETYTETRAHIGFGWSEGEAAHRYAAFMRECIEPETAWAFYRAIEQFDVDSLLPQVSSPTLVLHRRQLYWANANVEVAKHLAAGIPDARLALLEGVEHAPYLGDVDAVLSAIGDFLGTGPAQIESGRAPGAFVTILFTDMESSTALTQQLGDEGAQEVRRTHNDIVRAALNTNSGSEIKHTGDGIMASFSTASAALDCAIAIQQGVAAYKEEHPDSPLGVYVGLNAGEPIAEDDDLFGTSVDLAARLVDHAQPGQIIASDVVRQLAAGKDFLFADLGDTELRGFEDPVKLWDLRWQDD